MFPAGSCTLVPGGLKDAAAVPNGVSTGLRKTVVLGIDPGAKGGWPGSQLWSARQCLRLVKEKTAMPDGRFEEETHLLSCEPYVLTEL